MKWRVKTRMLRRKGKLFYTLLFGWVGGKIRLCLPSEA